MVGCSAAGLALALVPVGGTGLAYAATDLGPIGRDVAISGDGRIVAFVTAVALAPADTNAYDDVYVVELGGAPELVSVGTGGAGSGVSVEPALNHDGTIVAFTSRATNFDPLDRDTGADVYVRDRAAGRTLLVSVAPDMWVGDAPSHSPSISANGAHVAFVSAASNLAGLPPGGPEVVQVLARATRSVEVVGTGTGGQATHPRLSADGSAVAFLSTATGLAGDADADRDAFLTRLGGGTTTLLTPGPASVPDGDDAAPAVSASGDVVAFVTPASLRPDDTDGLADVYVGAPGTPPSLAAGGDGATLAPSLSADGTMVVLIGVAASEPASRDAIAIGPAGATVLAGDVGGPPATSYTAAETAYPDTVGRLVLAAAPGTGTGLVAALASPAATAFSARLAVHVFGGTAAEVGVDVDLDGLDDHAGTPPGDFTVEVRGPRRVAIHAVDAAGGVMSGWAVLTPAVCPEATWTSYFGDIPLFRYDALPAACLRARGLVAGAGGNAFEPARALTRREMAVMLARVATFVGASSGAPAATFADVDSASWGAADIGTVGALGVTAGCASNRFCPDAPVTREQMAVFLVRLRALVAPSPAGCAQAPFGDVAGSYARAAIGEIACLGITAGTGPGIYGPADPVVRGAMATFLLRLLQGVAA